MRVSCKAALYTHDRKKVLLAEYGPGDYGLPGGHMEEGETPERAMARELFEELGIKDVDLERKDFWPHHSNSKLILGFTGEFDDTRPLVIQEKELSAAKWVPIADIANGTITAQSYDEFILKFQNA